MSNLAKIKTHQILVLKLALAVLFILLGIFFVKHEKAELVQVKAVLLQADKWFMLSACLFQLERFPMF